ncbi:cytochrome c biogenesis protein CcdA [Leptolyngbya sp. FACHB-261]|uniref:cytochrome c biogenesis protein CcdA n=1 Tax=Leptolyngbya sp. FACHB-261 TaxID=2692806 RepID=UPI001686241D|nr:cytochrome c biogenesis protein CcdA [Leptolyngbya sp. FACHB-261]MBD2103258.1 sulfite exporter TauE/SafE family protein [Leptolyngbya sp. FACHB-261]
MTRTKRLAPKPFSLKLAQQIGSKFLLPALLCGLTAWLLMLAGRVQNGAIPHAVEALVFALEDSYQPWLGQQTNQNPLVLIPLAFGGGLIASLSPCILSLLPVNLSYIGTREISSRWDAFLKAGAFVLGVVTVLSLFGLFSSLAGLVLVQFRGYIQIAVGLIVLLMGLSLAGLVRLPLPPTPTGASLAGPYGVGLTFALVSSPCTSPVLFSVLAAAAATGSPMQSTLAMVSYALGYTAVIFLASLFAGLLKQTRILLNYSEAILRFGSVALVLMGSYYLVTGIGWALALAS